jgi:DNA polymerase-4
MVRVILHVDMDAFFASIEQRDNPELKGKPVIVGADPKEGKGRGVVSACSYEARRYGIHSAMPISHAYFRCPDAYFLPVDMKRYSETSAEIMGILHRFTPAVEPVSIDEAFLDVTGSIRLFGSGVKIASLIKETIKKEERLIASIGIGPNKLIAKIASDISKPDGLLEVKPEDVSKFLTPLPITRLYGVGMKMEAKLLKMGIEKVGELLKLSEEELSSMFGEMGRKLKEMAQGIDHSPVLAVEAPKSMAHEVTFEQDISDGELIEKELLLIAERLARRLRRRGLAGRTIILKFRFPDFTTVTRSHTLSHPVYSAEEIYNEIRRLLSSIKRKKLTARLLGIVISKLEPRGEGQLPLFNMKEKGILKAEDEIAERFGDQAITRASLIDIVKRKFRSH